MIAIFTTDVRFDGIEILLWCSKCNAFRDENDENSFEKQKSPWSHDHLGLNPDLQRIFEAQFLTSMEAVSETSHFLLFLRTMALVVGFLRPVFLAVIDNLLNGQKILVRG